MKTSDNIESKYEGKKTENMTDENLTNLDFVFTSTTATTKVKSELVCLTERMLWITPFYPKSVRFFEMLSQ